MSAEFDQNDLDVARQMARLDERLAVMQGRLTHHVEEEEAFQARVTDQLARLRTEHVIVRAGASTIVKLIVWGAAIIGGAVTAIGWLRDHVRWTV